VIRRADLPSIDEIIPSEDQQQQAAPGAQPSAQGPAQAAGGSMVPMSAMQGGGR
jgi:hypothetical protein